MNKKLVRFLIILMLISNMFFILPLIDRVSATSSTFGTTSITDHGAATLSADTYRGVYATPASNGYVTSISGYFGPAWTSGEEVKCGLYYASNLSFYASTVERTDGPGVDPAWVTFVFSAPVYVAAGTYYYISCFADDSITVWYRATGGPGRISGTATYPTWDNPSEAASSNYGYAFYCTYTKNLSMSNPSPVNKSIDIQKHPSCNITVSNDNGGFMTVCFSENITGEWITRQCNTSCINGTYRWVNTYASFNNMTYWWKVTVGNAAGDNISAIYHFTTISGSYCPVSSDVTPTNHSIDVEVFFGGLYDDEDEYDEDFTGVHNYYVNGTSGSDTNTGTLANPFKSIQKAVNVSVNGDTIFIMAGEYLPSTGQIRIINKNTLSQYLTITRYNTDYVIINGSNCPRSLSNGRDAVFMLEDSSYIRINGLTINHSASCGITTRRVSSTSPAHIRVDNCSIANCTFAAFFVSSYLATPNNITFEHNYLYNDFNNLTVGSTFCTDETISFMGVTDFSINNNTIMNCCAENIDVKSGCKRGDVCYNIINTTGGYLHKILRDYWGGPGIMLDAGGISHNISIYNNMIYGNSTGISLNTESSGHYEYIYIYNNVINMTNESGGKPSYQGRQPMYISNTGLSTDLFHHIYIYSNTICSGINNIYSLFSVGSGGEDQFNPSNLQNIYLINNIFFTADTFSSFTSFMLNIHDIELTDNILIFSNNSFYRTSGTMYARWNESNHGISFPQYWGSNPIFINQQFVSSLNGDFHLNPISPCIDTGNDALVSGFDFDGISRPQEDGYDRGAYEYNVFVSNYTYWNVTISDDDGDPTSGSIEGSNGDSMSWSDLANGTRSIMLLTDLEYFVNYTIWLNYTDGDCDVFETFWFITGETVYTTTTSSATNIEETTATFNGYTAYDDNPTGLYEYYNLGDDAYGQAELYTLKGQTFTPSSTHNISNVNLKLFRVGNLGTITVTLRTTSGGLPTTTILATGTTDGNSLTTDTGGEWRTITFSSSYTVSSGTMYAIVAVQSSGSGSCYWRYDDSSSSYTGGTFCRIELGSWVTYTSRDFMFEIYADTSIGFQYGTTISYGTTVDDADLVGQNFSYNISSLTPGKLYHYRAYLQVGASYYYGDDTSFLTKPNTPSGLTTTPTNTSITLGWTKGTGANNTYIEKYNDTEPLTLIYNNTGTSYIDTDVEPGNIYYYRALSYTVWDDLYQYSDTYSSTAKLTNPDSPINDNITRVDNNLSLSWDKGAGANSTVVVLNYYHMPTSPTDGTIIYNNTGDNIAYPYDMDLNYFFKAWSYTSWSSLHSFSITGLEFSFVGRISINVYNESNPSQNLTFNIEISDTNGTNVYKQIGVNNTLYIDMDEIPTGENVVFIIDAVGYRTRLYYLDIDVNAFYNFSFYLPEITPGGGSSSDENQTQLYLFTVYNRYNNGLEGAKICIKRYINTSNSYENVSILLTDSIGQADAFLIPYRLYQFVVSKDDFITSTTYWTPTIDIRTHSFILDYDIPIVNNTIDPYDVITFTAGFIIDNLTISIDVLDSTGNLSDASIYIYENQTLIYQYNFSVCPFHLDYSNNLTSPNNNLSEYIIVLSIRNHPEFPSMFSNFTILIQRSNPHGLLLDLDLHLTEILGNPGEGIGVYIGWINIFLCGLGVFIIVSFGRYWAGIGIAAMGLVIGLVEFVFGLPGFTGIQLISFVAYCIIMGALVEIGKAKQGRIGY